jgi:hypothetical protein
MIIDVTLVRGVFGAILLFLGRELNFVFAGGFAVLFAFRMLPLLPDSWPSWADTAFIVGMGLVVAAIALTNTTFGYYVSGFLGGGFLLVEYFAPGGSGIPLIPFFVGSVLGSLIMGFFGEWALMIISSVVGAYFVVDLFTLRREVEMMISGALFMVGALVQVILWRMQRYAGQ